MTVYNYGYIIFHTDDLFEMNLSILIHVMLLLFNSL